MSLLAHRPCDSPWRSQGRGSVSPSGLWGFPCLPLCLHAPFHVRRQTFYPTIQPRASYWVQDNDITGKLKIAFNWVCSIIPCQHSILILGEKKPSLNIKGRAKLFSASFKHTHKKNTARQLQLVKIARSDAQSQSTVPSKWAGWMDPFPLP